MTALRKFLPSEHDESFTEQRARDFATFIRALNAPLPELFNYPFLVSQSLRERGAQAIIPSVTAEGQQ